MGYHPTESLPKFHLNTDHQVRHTKQCQSMMYERATNTRYQPGVSEISLLFIIVTIMVALYISSPNARKLTIDGLMLTIKK